MVRFPDGTYAGTVEDRLLMFADIPATILSLAGIRPPSYMHGIPFLGRYEGRERSYVYGARDRLDEIVERQTCVRDARYRYVRNHLPEKSGLHAGPFTTQHADDAQHGEALRAR